MNGGWRGLRGTRYTYRLGRHLYEGGLGARGSSLLTHTTPYPIPRRRSRIALYNRLFAQSIITRRRGMGYKIPPWGKGLIKVFITLIFMIMKGLGILNTTYTWYLYIKVATFIQVQCNFCL